MRKITKDLFERNYQTEKSLLMFSTIVLIFLLNKIQSVLQIDVLPRRHGEHKETRMYLL